MSGPVTYLNSVTGKLTYVTDAVPLPVTGGGGGNSTGGNVTVIAPLGNQTAAASVATFINGGNVTATVSGNVAVTGNLTSGGNVTVIGPLGNQTGAASVAVLVNGGNLTSGGNVTVSSGNITVSSSASSAAVTLTRTNDTNAYLANDVVGAATGSTAALTFGLSAGQFMITSASLEIDISAVVSGMLGFTLQLYNVTPPSALGDNAAWDLPSGDRASYLGSIALGTPVDLGSTLYVNTAQLNQQIKIAGTANLFAYLVTNGAWTPAASTVFVITLYGVLL